MDNRSNLSIKMDALQRLIMVNTLSGVLPLYIVNEYPKSGGSWLAQMLSKYLRIPFPRNRRPNLTSSLMHGHMQYSPLMKNVFCLHRDGRDIIVSFYYHSLFQNDKNSPILVERTRKDLNFSDLDDITANLPAFIEYVYRRDEASKSPFHFSWPQFVNGWENKGSAHLKYEDLVNNGVETLTKAIETVTGVPVDTERLTAIYQEYSFENQTRRKPGEENKTSFLRKGQPGDWLEKFDYRAAKVFDELAGKELIKLGYEPDSSWVEQRRATAQTAQS